MPAVVLLLSAALLLALDQATKALILVSLREGQAAAFGGIAIRRVTHVAAGRRVLDGRTPLTIIWLLEVVFLISMVEFAPISDGMVAPIALGAAVGGAGGNLVDRLWREGVVDFIDLGWWPVFNLADVAIVAGGVVGCAASFFELAA
jgi:signal peptidase II